MSTCHIFVVPKKKVLPSDSCCMKCIQRMDGVSHNFAISEGRRGLLQTENLIFPVRTPGREYDHVGTNISDPH